MCKGNCKCNSNKDQMKEMLTEIVEAFEYYQTVNGRGLTLQQSDIDDIKEILNNNQ